MNWLNPPEIANIVEVPDADLWYISKISAKNIPKHLNIPIRMVAFIKAAPTITHAQPRSIGTDVE